MPSRFSLMLLLVLSAQAAGQPKVPTTQPARWIDLPSYGMSLPIPQGYSRDADGDNSAVYLVPTDAVGKQPAQTRLITVLLRMKGQASLAEIAAQLAKADGMRVSSGTARWGDRPAVELVPAQAVDPAKRTARHLLTEREGWVFWLAFVADAPRPVDVKAFDEVAKNTRWLPIGSAASGVAPRQPSFNLPNGMSVSIPDPFRPDMKKEKRSTSTFLALDLPSQTVTATLLIIPFPPEDPNRTLQSMENDAGANLMPLLKTNDPLVWQDESDVIAFARSKRLTTADGSAQMLIALNRQKAATVFLLRCKGDEKELRQFEKALDCVRDSIRVLATATGNGGAK